LTGCRFEITDNLGRQNRNVPRAGVLCCFHLQCRREWREVKIEMSFWNVTAWRTALEAMIAGLPSVTDASSALCSE
jgi:hypothetical protein